MRKYKFSLNVLLIFVLIFSIIIVGLLILECSAHWKLFNDYVYTLKFTTDTAMRTEIEKYISITYQLTFAAIFSVLIALASVVTLIILNLKVFRSVDFAEVIANAESKAQARKAKRVQIKAERAEADKQAKIQELEKQLEELKRDE